MAKELRLVIDVALCLRAWKKVARRQRQKREKAALAAPPPLDEPQSPPPPTEAPPPSVPAAQPTVLCEAVSDCVLPAELSPPPPVEPPPPTPPAETAAAPDEQQEEPVEPPPPPTETPAVEATNKPRPAPKPLRDKSSQLPNATLRGPVGKGGTTRLWELLRPPTQCLVLEFHALDGPRRIPPLVAVDA